MLPIILIITLLINTCVFLYQANEAYEIYYDFSRERSNVPINDIGRLNELQNYKDYAIFKLKCSAVLVIMNVTPIASLLKEFYGW